METSETFWFWEGEVIKFDNALSSFIPKATSNRLSPLHFKILSAFLLLARHLGDLSDTETVSGLGQKRSGMYYVCVDNTASH
jgi:hypothetical protein